MKYILYPIVTAALSVFVAFLYKLYWIPKDHNFIKHKDINFICSKYSERFIVGNFIEIISEYAKHEDAYNQIKNEDSTPFVLFCLCSASAVPNCVRVTPAWFAIILVVEYIFLTVLLSKVLCKKKFFRDYEMFISDFRTSISTEEDVIEYINYTSEKEILLIKEQTEEYKNAMKDRTISITVLITSTVFLLIIFGLTA